MTIGDTAQETTGATSSRANLPVSPKWFAALGLIAGFGAVIASSCCVVPLGLAALGAGVGVLGGLEMIAVWRIPLLSFSALAIMAAGARGGRSGQSLAFLGRTARRRNAHAQRWRFCSAPR